MFPESVSEQKSAGYVWFNLEGTLPAGRKDPYPKRTRRDIHCRPALLGVLRNHTLTNHTSRWDDWVIQDVLKDLIGDEVSCSGNTA